MGSNPTVTTAETTTALRLFSLSNMGSKGFDLVRSRRVVQPSEGDVNSSKAIHGEYDVVAEAEAILADTFVADDALALA